MSEVKDTLTLDTNALDVFNKIMSLIDNTMSRIHSLNNTLDSTTGSSKALDTVAGAVDKIGVTSEKARIKIGHMDGRFKILSTTNQSLISSSDKVSASTNKQITSFGRLNNVINSAKNSLDSITAKFKTFISNMKDDPLGTIKNGFKSFFDSAANGFGSVKQKLTELPPATQGWQMSLMGVKAAIDLIKMGVAAIKGFIGFSDNLTQTKARVDLVNDGLHSTDAVMRQIADSALRSGGNMDAMAQSVASLRANAGEVFKTAQDAIAFNENLNKIFTFSGTDSTGADSVMYNLTQALSTGILRGQDFNAVLSNAPAIIQYMADEMGVPISKMREMANNGELSADIVRNALINATDDINKKFDSIPMTFSRAFNMVKTESTMAFMPVNEAINDLVSSDTFMSFISVVIGGFQALSAIVADYVLPGISTAMGFVANNIDYVIAILATLGVIAVVVGIKMFASWIAATWPLLLIIGIVVAIIAIFKNLGYTGTEIFGAIVGSINVAIQWCKNFGLTIANMALGSWEVLKAFSSNTITAFKNAGLNIRAFFEGTTATILGFIVKIAEGLNKLPFVEFDYSGLSAAADEWASKKTATLAERGEYTNINDAWSKGAGTYDTFNEGWGSDAFKSGYSAAEKIADKLGTFDIQDKLNSIGSGGGLGDLSAIDNISGIGKVGSVGKIEDDVNISEEDLKLLKDIRQREVLVGITTPADITYNDYGDNYGDNAGKFNEFLEAMKDGEANVTTK